MAKRHRDGVFGLGATGRKPLGAVAGVGVDSYEPQPQRLGDVGGRGLQRFGRAQGVFQRVPQPSQDPVGVVAVTEHGPVHETLDTEPGRVGDQGHHRCCGQ